MSTAALLEKDIPVADLRFIIETLFKVDFYAFVSGSVSLDAKQKLILNSVLKQYHSGIPLEYILKRSGFFGLDLEVSKATFIPRNETEILTEEVLKFTEGKQNLYLLDIGTGSGNISITLGLKRPGYKVFALDISASALEVALRNKKRYKLKNVFFIRADLVKSFKPSIFDIIVSNPPYVETGYIEDKSFLKYEPRIALEAGFDGLTCIRRILDTAKDTLKKKGVLFLEIGYNHREQTLDYASFRGWEFLYAVKDYSGIDRVIVLRKL